MMAVKVSTAEKAKLGAAPHARFSELLLQRGKKKSWRAEAKFPTFFFDPDPEILNSKF